MSIPQPGRLLAMLAGCTGVGWLLWWAAEPDARELASWLSVGKSARVGWTLEDLVVDAAVCLSLLVFVGLVVSCVANVVVGLLPRARPIVANITGPTWWRGLVLGALGLGLGAPALSTSALAVTAPTVDPGAVAPAHPACAVPLAGLRLPDLPTSSRHHIAVAPGDSLWLISSRLTPEADVSSIAARVAALYDANRSTIGPDPDLIIPGVVLDAPTTHPKSHRRYS